MPLPRRRPFLSFLLVLLLGIGIALFQAFAPAPGQPEEKKPAPTEAKTRARKVVGSPSCSAESCHGSVTSHAGFSTSHDEFTHWIHRDPHVRAFEVLSLENEVSKKIGKLMGITPQEDARCLACHSSPLTVSPVADIDQRKIHHAEQRWGIGCESCHGAAQDWLLDHTKSDWLDLSSPAKAQRGMVPLNDPGAVFHVCAGCHVGAPARDGMPLRDVTHDMIAAGHPRLNFEPSTFLENLPPHWKTERGKRWKGDRPATKDRVQGQIWAVGQLVAARDALDLTRDRIDRDGGGWPELAEFNCFACHHDLQARSWRQDRSLATAQQRHPPGTVPWNEWPWTGPTVLAETSLKNSELKPAIDAVRTQLRIPSTASKDEVKAKTARLRNTLDGMLKRVSAAWGQEDSRTILFELATKDLLQPGDWDRAEQIYLGLLALNQDAKIASIDELLRGETMVNLRAHPPGFTSPRNFMPDEFFPRIRNAILKAR